MPQDAEFPAERLVPPLLARTRDDTPYERPAAIQAHLSVLLNLPAGEVARRARITDPGDPDYLPSECLLHLVRPHDSGQDHPAIRDLFVALRQRVLRAVPVRTRRLAGTSQDAEKTTDVEIRDLVLHKFQELICGDRNAYDQRLDYYECKFNDAVANLRRTARRTVRRQSDRLKPLLAGEDSGEVAAEVEAALQRVHGPGSDPQADFLFREKLSVAISSLPPDERRVIELTLQGMPVDSKVQEVLTIAQVLRCTEKTVRNRRTRAYARLRDALEEGSES